MEEKTLFLDENHNFAEPEKASWKVIHKYDDKGRLKEEVWVDLKTIEKKS